MAITIDKLYDVMMDVFMLDDFEITSTMTALDVPNWDSLHHTMLIMELERISGAVLSPKETAQLANIQELYEYILARIPAGH